MKAKTHPISQRCMAYVLLISFFLQSCSNFSNSITPRGNEEVEHIQELTPQTKHLAGQELTADMGHLVTFYEENAQLQADVRVDEKQKEPNYKNLPVNIAPDIDLNQLPHLNQRAQKSLIHFIAPNNGLPGSVSIFKSGLRGGMVRNDEDKSEDENIPDDCFCPITQEIMEDPVMAQDGHTYEKAAIKRWFDMGKRTSPKTGARLLSTELVPNYTLRSLIQDLKKRLPVLARHKLNMDNIEVAIKLREEEIQQALALKGNLLHQEQVKVELTTTTRSSISQVGAQPSINTQLRELIFKIAEHEPPFWDILTIEGGLQEKSSRSALADMQMVLLGELNSQLKANHNDVGSAMKDAISKNILARPARIVYARINEAAEDAKQGISANKLGTDMCSQVIINSSRVDESVLGVRGLDNKEIDQLVIQAIEGSSQAFNKVLTIAEGNECYAQYKLGLMYDDGQVVAQDDKKAFEWYQKAADQGYADAQYNLGLMYANGQGVDNDDKKAVAWYQKAADQGNPDAQNNLGVMYANGQGVAQDDKKAVAWYQKAAEQGDAQAQCNLGFMYKYGQGVDQDYKKAVEWYQKGADQGDAGAQFRLGLMYENGDGVD